MPLSLTRFAIIGLHGAKTIELPVTDDTLLLVGVNGVGKTTLISILYLTLSRQWERLSRYPFASIELELNGTKLTIKHETLEDVTLEGGHQADVLRRYFPNSIARRIEVDPELLSLLRQSHRSTPTALRLGRLLGVPTAALFEASRRLETSRHGDRQQRLGFDAESPLASVDAHLRKHVDSQVLYLPTYRRIERDLQAIFPELEDDVKRFRHQRITDARDTKSSFIELVEFGMEDVEQKLRRNLIDLKESARTQLNNLAGGYLRDVIRKEAGTYDPTKIATLDETTIGRILDRIEENSLDDGDKLLLREVVEKVRRPTSDLLTAEERYIAHFLAKLVDIHLALTAKESAVASFVSLCNEYLEGKHLIFDDRAYSISIRLSDSTALEMRDLSSGEKQIVSLFSHLHLESETGFVVLIDEPELSLSAAWQKRLLPDIRATGKCSFLAAVTHSPFIFDNSLDPMARDLSTCVSKYVPANHE